MGERRRGVQNKSRECCHGHMLSSCGARTLGVALTGFFAVEYTTPIEKRRLKRINVYVDESGDRNFGKTRQSDYFTATAVMIEAENDQDLTYVIGGLKALFQVPQNEKLHWKKHLRQRDEWRRTYAFSRLRNLPGAKVATVTMHKPSLNSHYLTTTHELSYNYVIKLLLERVVQAAKNWQGGERVAHVRLGVVGGVDHEVTKKYLHSCALHPRPHELETPWENMMWPPVWRQNGDYAGLQIADLYSGAFHCGQTAANTSHLETIKHQITVSEWGQIHGHGVKLYPQNAVGAVRLEPWFKCLTKSEASREGSERR